MKQIIEMAGGQYKGTMQFGTTVLHLFNDPQTGTTLALYDHQVTPEQVQKHLLASRATFAAQN